MTEKLMQWCLFETRSAAWMASRRSNWRQDHCSTNWGDHSLMLYDHLAHFWKLTHTILLTLKLVVLRTHFSEAIKAIRWGALGKSLQVESAISSSRISSVWLISSIDFFKINKSFNWKFVKQLAKRCGELVTKNDRFRRIENKSSRCS